jgi:hypothetical protein
MTTSIPKRRRTGRTQAGPYMPVPPECQRSICVDSIRPTCAARTMNRMCFLRTASRADASTRFAARARPQQEADAAGGRITRLSDVLARLSDYQAATTAGPRKPWWEAYREIHGEPAVG